MTSEHDQLKQMCTCPVCYGIFENPHCLSCLHVLCLACVDKIKKFSIVECPECRKITQSWNIQHDFKIQKLVDLYTHEESWKLNFRKRSEQSVILSVTPPNIPVLLTPRSPGLQLKSNGCNKAISENSLDTNRVYQYKKPPPSGAHADVKRMRKRRDKNGSIIPSARCLVSVTPPSFSYFFTEQENLDTYWDTGRSFSDQIEDNHHENDILNASVGLNNSCEMGDTNLEHLFTHNNSTDTSYHDDIVERRGSLEILGTDADLNSNNVILNNNNNSNTETIDTVFQKVKTIILTYSPRRLHVTDTTLWCTADNGVHMYDRECNLINTVVFTDIEMQDVACTLQDSQLNMIVACRNGRGLYLLDSFGKLIRKMCDGSFSDITITNNIMYALNTTARTIMLFQHKKQRGWFSNTHHWVFIKSIDLKYRNCCSMDTLSVLDGAIYVCSWVNSCLYKLTHSGEEVEQLGKKGCDELGQLASPIICAGNMSDLPLVIADRNNHRLQVCHQDGKFELVNFSEDIGQPRDVFLNKSGDEMWIFSAELYSKSLSVFKRHEPEKSFLEQNS